MKKSSLVTILIIVILAAGAWAIWLSLQQSQSESPQNGSSNTNTAPQLSSQEQQGTDQTTPQQSNATQVTIKNRAYSPAKVTIKKGTTVTWTNEDSMGHNVVTANAATGGGLPTTAQLLAKGEKFSHTFTEVGTFNYFCTPHPDMKGTVEVTE